MRLLTLPVQSGLHHSTSAFELLTRFDTGRSFSILTGPFWTNREMSKSRLLLTTHMNKRERAPVWNRKRRYALWQSKNIAP